MSSTKSGNERWLLISDLQVPFEHDNALKFCKWLQKEFRIPKTHIINLGDEVDQYWASQYPKSPDAFHTAMSEIHHSVSNLRHWYKAFPEMKLCNSNHGDRWMKKALQSEIPSQMLRDYRKILQAPPGWKWQKNWVIKTKHPFMVEHGDDWGGSLPHTQAALHNGMSTAMGHHHSKATVTHFRTKTQSLWGAVGGSLIDVEQYAFEYSRRAKLQPCLGTLVVVDSGKTPIWVDMEAF